MHNHYKIHLLITDKIIVLLLTWYVARTVQKIAGRMNLTIEHMYDPLRTDMENKIINAVKPYTFTPLHAILSLIDSVKYVIENDIQGSLVECGVYRGGSVMAMIMTLQEMGVSDRHIYLYDTFEGMSKPGMYDKRPDGTQANIKIDETITSLDIVQNNIKKLDYDLNKIHFVKGKVEDTLSKNIPNDISLLRLDTDWYESTKCEFEYLYPKLSRGGVLIVDDYESFLGCKKATNEYLKGKILLHRIVPSGARIGVKC